MAEHDRERLFLDASTLVAGVISSSGGSGYILLLGEMGSVDLLVCEQVLVETRRALGKKAPRALPEFERIMRAIRFQLCLEPKAADIVYCQGLIHQNDAPILAAALIARPDSLITLNTRHFLDDPQVAQKSGLRIETPGTYLIRRRQRFADDDTVADS